MALPSSYAPVRDPKYYFPDGNTVILVKNTLFKIHRFQLMRDQSVFESMFSCPTMVPSEGLEGESDDNPIRLQDDSVEEVRALIGYLYSLPHEAQKNLSNDADFQRFCHLARIAHKYSFDSIERWALDMDIIKAFWVSLDNSTRIPISRLVETTSIVALGEDVDLAGIVTDVWMTLIESGDVSDTVLAITTAEQYGMSTVKGHGYYTLMILGRNVWDQGAGLTVPQRVRLLSGFHDLVHRCDLLENQDPPEIEHKACALSPLLSVARCKENWIDLWKSIFVDHERFIHLSPADYIGRLSLIALTLRRQVLDMTTAPRQVADGCLMSAVAKVEAMSEECMENLPHLFVDLK